MLREIGLPAGATLATTEVISPDFYDALGFGVQALVAFFGGVNAASRDILAARTTPVTVRDLGDTNVTWRVGMMVSTAAFPDAAAIPAPVLPVQLETIGLRTIAAVQFNTTSLPLIADFVACADRLRAGPLPKGYLLDEASAWTPTYVLYSAEVATYYTNECWVEVTKAAVRL